MIKVLESEHINFIKLDESLVDDYLIMVNDPEVQNKISPNIKYYTKEQELEWIRSKLANNAMVFSLIEKTTGKFIGNIEIMAINNNIGELGISLTPTEQNKHYGTEAIKALLDYAYNQLKLTGMELNVYLTNPKAIHCYEKIGFVKTGPGKNTLDIHMIIKR
jgi:RimJ/RimL family protein N-acetyltransferase